MKPKLIILIGSPGSGKSSYIKQLKSDGFIAFDDYFACAKNDQGIMDNSKHKDDLIKSLIDQENCVIADIRFSQPEIQDDINKFLTKNNLNVITDTEWHGFEQDDFACEKNVENREKDDKTKQKEKNYIEEFSPRYSLPSKAIVLKTWIWPKKINFKIKNDRDEFSITVEAEKMWGNKEAYNDIRIKYSIKIINNNKDWEVHIPDVIAYIDWCEHQALIEEEKTIEKILIREIKEIIKLDSPGLHNIQYQVLDFRTKKLD